MLWAGKAASRCIEFANVATFADGLMVELRAYGGWLEALEAVGLRE
jgi:hypothetical protein